MIPDHDEWLQWAAYNLGLGVPHAQIKDEMIKNGFAGVDVDEALKKLSSCAEFKATQKLARNFRLCSALNDALLQLESQSFDFRQLRRVSGLSSQEFHANYYCLNRPVIIDDVVNAWPASSKWSMEYLRNCYGDESVVYQNGRASNDHRDCFVDHSVRANFKDFLDVLGRPTHDSSPAYLIAHDRLLDKPAFKSLLDDIIFDPRYFDGNDTHGRVFFWLGTAGSATPMHRDLGNVYLAQVKGRKLIRMVPSKQLHLMYNEVGYHSEADFNNLSFEDFPLLKGAYISETVINPGDLLFIPVGWWHHVKCLETSITITGNNFCFPNSLTPIF